MALFSREKDFAPVEYRIPTGVKERLTRGREEMLRNANKRRLCMRFEKGETYWWLNEANKLLWQSTVTYTTGGGKPPHRIRNRYNGIRPIVEGKISAATQRTPGYQVIPTTTDPERASAAKNSERVARYGYDKWRLRNMRMDVVKLALAGGGEGFAMPYFDPNVGPYNPVIDADGNLKHVGQGEVRYRIYNGNEVYWEPHVAFENSSWWATEQAVPIDVIVSRPDYAGGKIVPDAIASEIPTDKTGTSNLAMVVEYYERPSARIPLGRKLTICNKRVIYPPEDYPLRTAPSPEFPEGQVLDEPIIHRLCYTHDSESHRDLGLVWQLIDFQRTYQDCWNKLLEWKNRCLVPRMKAPIGSLIKQPDDEPGGIDWFKPTGGVSPEWEKPPAVPQELIQLRDDALRDMRAMAADEQFDAGPDVAAKTVQTVLETARARWAAFIGDLAEFDSRFMRHCLLLVARHYTESRTISVLDTRFGPYTLQAFRGAQLLDQQDVIVLPSSIVSMTREAQEERIFAFADRQWIPPEYAMAAINTGLWEGLIESYELDKGRINRIIQKIRDGSVFDLPPRVQTDPMTGFPVIGPDGQPMQVPGYMPDEQDNLVVWRTTLSDWMKTEEFEQLDAGMQEVCRQMLRGIQMLEAQQQMRAMQAQEAEATSQGMDNASKPVREKPSPNQRKTMGPDGNQSSQ